MPAQENIHNAQNTERTRNVERRREKSSGQLTEQLHTRSQWANLPFSPSPTVSINKIRVVTGETNKNGR
ncbi:unnamed protein product [Bursaphelenchus okinawaensis]|uniref:Uncharacterized protein n=1 Tax=Bursaphelenchus okinawaensis TaxID=465554 RepID=A0A811LM52_9BILA|nr:unnamed protein product [Bursaphelenchus okinawaensis]CAG9126962.1 unnamed protein product [Bursaphelenchus okinawaensis]